MNNLTYPSGLQGEFNNLFWYPSFKTSTATPTQTTNTNYQLSQPIRDTYQPSAQKQQEQPVGPIAKPQMTANSTENQPYQEPVIVYNDTPSENQGSSLMGSFMGNVGIWGGIKSIPLIMHPINSKNALTETLKIFKDNPALKNLTSGQQAEAFSKLYSAARLQPRFANEAAQLPAQLLKNQYINALKAGDTVEMARKGAELSTFANKNVKGLIFNRKPDLEQITNMAKEAGNSAAKVASEAKAAEAALKGASMGQKAWSGFKTLWKEGGGWFCVALESLGQIPELIAAYKQGEAGDGIKQTVKSAAKVTINTTGWIVGAAAGKAAGTAIGVWAATKAGALAGTAFNPGIGSAIGAVVGFIGGLVGMAAGSWGAEKISKAIVGKSF
ncbi:hypothetical protein IJS77_01270, partial [bacterium]|nr:hypothetical protein [bacterium]